MSSPHRFSRGRKPSLRLAPSVAFTLTTTTTTPTPTPTPTPSTTMPPFSAPRSELLFVVAVAVAVAATAAFGYYATSRGARSTATPQRHPPPREQAPSSSSSAAAAAEDDDAPDEAVEAAFEQAKEDANALKVGIEDQLRLYGLFKRATVGVPSPSERPGMLDQVGRAKFDAWTRAAEAAGSREVAMEAYVQLVREIMARGANASAANASANAATSMIAVSQPKSMVTASAATPGATADETAGDMVVVPGMEEGSPDFERARANLDDVAAMLATTPSLAKEHDGTGRSLLHFAVDAEHAAAVDALLASGAVVDDEDVEGLTPLAYAATIDSVAMVTRLLAAGAHPMVEGGAKYFTSLAPKRGEVLASFASSA